MTLGTLAAVAVIAVGTVFYLRSRAASEEQASGRLAEANLLFWRGDYQRSLESAKQVYGQYPSTPSGVDAHRLAGDDAFWLGDYKSAVGEYRKYLEGEHDDLLASAGHRSLAYALDSDKQYAEAATTYTGLVGKFDRESSAEFLAAAARCQQAAGRPADAVKSLQRLVDEFGETSYANRARMDLAALQSTGTH
jgi:tetratricopeptide (TPR) repeat protein